MCAAAVSASSECTALESEWKAREAEREAEVARVKAEYQRLEAKLKSHLLDIEKRCLRTGGNSRHMCREPRLALAEKEIERERVRMREELDLSEKNKADEILRARNKYSQVRASVCNCGG